MEILFRFHLLFYFHKEDSLQRENENLQSHHKHKRLSTHLLFAFFASNQLAFKFISWKPLLDDIQNRFKPMKLSTHKLAEFFANHFDQIYLCGEYFKQMRVCSVQHYQSCKIILVSSNDEIWWLTIRARLKLESC